MRFEDVAMVAFLLAMILIFYQGIDYMARDGGPALISDQAYKGSAGKDAVFVPTSYGK
jgi:hypothetical protein